MGFLSKLFGKTTKKDAPIEVNVSGEFSVNVVGESHYQEHLERICGGRREEGSRMTIAAQLIYDNNNPYDNNAIRIDILGKPVGFLCKTDAENYRTCMLSKGFDGRTATCMAKISGGWKRESGDIGAFGVVLYIREEFFQIVADNIPSLHRNDGTVDTAETTFWVEDAVVWELPECRLGDFVKFWIPKDDPDLVFIYRRRSVGGTGRIGVVPYRHARAIAGHMSDESGERGECETEIVSLDSNHCKIRYRLISETETAANKAKKLELLRADKAKKLELLRAELTKKYTPSKPFTIFIDPKGAKALKSGEKLKIEFDELEFYVRDQYKWQFRLIDKKGRTISPKWVAGGNMKKILKAHFNEYSFDVEVVSATKKLNEYCYSDIELRVTPYKGEIPSRGQSPVT